MVKPTRSMIRETVDRISAVHACKSSNFMELFRLSGLPENTFKGEVMEGWDLSYADLRSLDLTGTTFVNCNTAGTIFPNHVNIKQIALADSLYQESRTQFNTNSSQSGKVTLQESTEESADIRMHEDDDDDDDENYSLLAAIQDRNETKALKLLEYWIDVNEQDLDGRTVLMHATQAGYLTMVRLLIENGADLNAQSNDGSTALMLAIEYEKEDIEKLLTEKGAIQS